MKTEFSWDDREKSFFPCDYCEAWKFYPTDTDSTNTACNHCDYNIILHCLGHIEKAED